MSSLTIEQEKEALRYDLQALKEHIDKRKTNIKIYEQAIDTERSGIELDLRMIAFLESKKKW